MSAVEDDQRRPVVFETRAEPNGWHRRGRLRPVLRFALAVLTLAGAAGLAVGGSAVWSAVAPRTANNTPVPLWITPPAAQSHSTRSTARTTRSAVPTAGSAVPTAGSAASTGDDQHRRGSGSRGR